MAVAVIVVMVMVVIVADVVIVPVAGVKEIRLDLEDALQIESAAVEHVRKLDLAALGAVNFRRRD